MDQVIEDAGRLLTTVYVSSYCYICVLILLGRWDADQVLEDAGRLFTTVYVSSYCYMCPHTTRAVGYGSSARGSPNSREKWFPYDYQLFLAVGLFRRY